MTVDKTYNTSTKKILISIFKKNDFFNHMNQPGLFYVSNFLFLEKSGDNKIIMLLLMLLI